MPFQLVGGKLAHYEVLAPLGAGAMAGSTLPLLREQTAAEVEAAAERAYSGGTTKSLKKESRAPSE